jgi:hypothetical protein
MLIEANLVQGLTDAQVEASFNQARDADWSALADEVRAAAKLLPKRGKLKDEVRKRITTEIERLRRRFDEIAVIDFFHAIGSQTVAGLLDELTAKLSPAPAPVEKRPEKFHARVWVTRKGIHVDRMASAWLIKRFIDRAASFKWVPPKGYQPRDGELRFDMFEAEFTHVGDNCTFEVLLQRTGLKDRALGAIAEIVHDIDIKDERYQRPETAGVASLVAGIALSSENDDERLSRASAAFDQLYEAFSRKR